MLVGQRRRRLQLRATLSAALSLAACDDWRHYDASPALDAGPCRATTLLLNAAWPFEKDTCRRTVCSREPDGSVIMSYCLTGTESDWPWASCIVASHTDLNGFDPDNGGQGLLEVVFCTDQAIAGALNLWYGGAPSRKYLPLLRRHETMAVGCRTLYFTPEMASFPQFDVNTMSPEDRAKSVPQRCSNRCGKTPSECRLSYGDTDLTLAGEFLAAGERADAHVRLLSVQHLSAGCRCNQPLDCDAERSVCRTQAFAPVTCANEAAAEGGVCAAPGTAECGDMVGRFADGWHAGVSEALVAAYERHYPALGCPFDNGGSPYVHEVRGIALQDFLQPEAAKHLADDGQTALAYNPAAGRAFLLFGEFWGVYKCLRHNGQFIGGAPLLGAPVDEKHWDGAAIVQTFETGSMTMRGAADAGSVTVHLSAHTVLDGDVVAECNGRPPVQIDNPP